MEKEKLDVGANAPEFILRDAYKNERKLSEFKGKWVVLYFYPKDNTPGCTIEALDFSALKLDFQENNAVVLGVSKDSCESHQKFIDDKGLAITLLSDLDASIQKKYGVWKPKKFMGKEFLGTVRTTYLIDPKGKIASIWPDVRVIGHAQVVLDDIRVRKNKSGAQ